MSQPLIVYHKRCIDGTASAVCAYTRFGSDAKYIPYLYNDSESLILKHEPANVYIVDFSFNLDKLQRIREHHKSVTVLDHHVTACKMLAGVPDCHLDTTKCGAIMTWEHFYPNDDIPILLEYVQDYDLWTFNLDYTREVNKALYALGDNFELWLPHLHDVSQLVDHGKILLAQDEVIVSRLIDDWHWIKLPFAPYRIPAINANMLINEVCQQLIQISGQNVVLAYYVTKERYVKISLRGTSDSDCLTIAKALNANGGGHMTSAGAFIDLPTFLSLYHD